MRKSQKTAGSAIVANKPNPIASNGQTRRITEGDAVEIARITSKGLNESEACAMLGFRRETWFTWKHENAVKYGNIFTRIRGQRIDGLLAQIDKAAEGKDGVRHDWRAADRLLAITAPDRFAARANDQSPAPTINVAILPSLAAQVYAPLPSPATAALPEPSGPAMPSPAAGAGIIIEPSQAKLG